MLSCLKKKSLFFVTFLLLLVLTLPNPTSATHQCGNGVCQPSGHHNETCSTCRADCGQCLIPTSTPAPQPTSAPSSQPTSAPAPSQPFSTPPPGEQSATPAPGETAPTQNSSSSTSTTSTPTFVYYPSVSLNTYIPNPTNKISLTFAGSATIEKGQVISIEYKQESSGWTTAPVTGGSFSFTLSQLTEGVHSITVRGKSDAGVFTKEENYTSQIVTVVTTPPRVTLDKISPNPTKNQTPAIGFAASSQFASITKAEISLDRGNSWQVASRAGNKFTFRVKNKLEDGNYEIMVRAFDNAGNIGYSPRQTLIIDTIPPIIGGSMHTLGPQILLPQANGVMRIAAGSQVQITLSMKGGPIKARVETQEKSFDLEKITGTNIWKGELKFDKSGENQLKIEAIDGAGNKTERNLHTILVEDFGKVLDSKTNAPLEKAQVNVYFYEKSSQTWILWEGSSYGQSNPQTTDNRGHYSFMVPPGKYYMEVKTSGFETVQSEILKLSQTSNLNFTFPLKPKPNIVLDIPILGEVKLSIPTFVPQTIKTEKPQESLKIRQLQLLNNPAPPLVLPNLQKREINLSDLKGKKIMVSFLSPWSPPSLEQASIFSNLSTSLLSDQEILTVLLQESQASAETFMKRGNYKFPVLVDRDGQSATNFQVTLLPQHFIIDSQGSIQEIVNGVISQNEALEKLIK